MGPPVSTQFLLNTLLNLVFPTDCVVCGEPAREWRRGPLCGNCESRFSPLKPPICQRCGFPTAARPVCGQCLTGGPRFDLGRSALALNDSLRTVIHHFKYNDRVSLARPLARILRECLDREAFVADRVVPVPLHPARERQRGYNQAELLAAGLGRPVRIDLVRRRKNSDSQTGLTRAQRIRNVRGAFECRGRISGSVLIVDDIHTTGATINEVARILKRSGASRVEAITVARAGLVPSPARLGERSLRNEP